MSQHIAFWVPQFSGTCLQGENFRDNLVWFGFSFNIYMYSELPNLDPWIILELVPKVDNRSYSSCIRELRTRLAKTQNIQLPWTQKKHRETTLECTHIVNDINFDNHFLSLSKHWLWCFLCGWFCEWSSFYIKKLFLINFSRLSQRLCVR